MTKAYPQIRTQVTSPTPVITMIERGRRALGEGWRKIQIGHDGDDYTISNEPTEAPADNKPIFVPALGNVSADMADYILEYQRKEAEYRARRPYSGRPQPTREKIQKMFLDYCEERIKWFKGQTQSGPYQTTQRTSLPQPRR